MTRVFLYYFSLTQRFFSLFLFLLGFIIFMTLGQGSALGEASDGEADMNSRAIINGLNEIRAKHRLSPLESDTDLDVAADYLVRMLVTPDGLDLSRRPALTIPLQKAGVQDRVVDDLRITWAGDPLEAVASLANSAGVKEMVLYKYYARLGIKLQKLTKNRHAAVIILSTNRLSPEIYGLQILELVNQARRAKGLSPTRWSQEAVAAAQARAKEVVIKHSHDRPDGRKWFSILKELGIKSSVSGENIATGQRDPAEVMDSWLNSPAHRENILLNKFTHLGVGLAVGSDAQPSWCQIFLGQ
jgi:uncharacterized protein YkwD